jgi:hypothetical protein
VAARGRGGPTTHSCPERTGQAHLAADARAAAGAGDPSAFHPRPSLLPQACWLQPARPWAPGLAPHCLMTPITARPPAPLDPHLVPDLVNQRAADEARPHNANADRHVAQVESAAGAGVAAVILGVRQGFNSRRRRRGFAARAPEAAPPCQLHVQAGAALTWPCPGANSPGRPPGIPRRARMSARHH